MSTRMHIVVSDELLAAVDGVRGDVPRSAWLRRVIERHVAEVEEYRRPGPYVSDAEREFRAVASEQALGSSGRAGVRGRVPASAPAEQPAVPSADLLTTPEVVRAAAAAGVFGGRVRSSSVARPFRPAPKQGKK